MNRLLGKNKDLMLVVGIVLILIILFSPIPPALLDLSIIINFAFALTILLLTFYVARPVEFSTFPSLLLVATLFRLSLNVASTRLILTGADAGDVIESIGNYAVQGNYIIGLVVFIILVIVQYVVVTSGAQRVSEVAARFTLDSMPGQQMSIDADLNLGLIDQKQAIERRADLQKEASFYGAMDGASKFVKGDAIAGVLILLINIIAGLIVGVAQMGMSWSEALQRFTLLTVGDGIAMQLPALIISIATGIIMTRSASDKELSTEIFRQLASEPRIPLIVMFVMGVLLLMPGMPKWPIVILLVVAFAAWWRIRRLAQTGAAGLSAVDDELEAAASAGHTPALEIALGRMLGEAWADRKVLLLERISTSRQSHERRFGIPFPAVRFVDSDDLADVEYAVRIHGVTHGVGRIYPDRVMAIPQNENAPKIEGMPGTDPAYGIPALWIERSAAERAQESGYSVVDPETAMVTHFVETVRSEVTSLLTRAITAELLDQLRDRQPGLVEELLPNVMTVSDIQRILQNLLAERVSIANLDLIVEVLVDLGRTVKDPAELTEQVRRRLGPTICSGLRGHDDRLNVLSLDPGLENRIITGSSDASAAGLGLDPTLADKLLRKLAGHAETMLKQGKSPVLLCSGNIRRTMARLTQRAIPQLAVVAVEEIPLRTALQSFDIVRVES